MAFIRKRGKKFSVIYRIKDDNGKERQTSETFSTQKDAERRQKEIEYKMAIGKFEVPKCTILEELIEEYVKIYGHDKWGVSTYAGNISLINNYILPTIGKVKLSSINTHFMEKYYKDLLEMPAVKSSKNMDGSGTITESTVNEIHKILRSAFRQAVKWDLMEKNPAVDATVPKAKTQEREIWTAEMLMQALEACDNKMLKIAFHLAFTATLRIGELLGLTWDEMDISEEAIANNRAYVIISKQVERVSRNAVAALNSKEIILIFPTSKKNNKTVRVLKTPKTDSSTRKVYIPKSVAQCLVELKAEQDEIKEALGNEYQDYNFEITKYKSQKITLSKETIDLYYMLVQLSDELSPVLAPRGNTVTLHLDENLTIEADPEKLARVFNNILKNAASYSFPHTEIVISAEKLEHEVIIRFQNSGEDIPNEALASLFNKFYRVDQSRSSDTGGTGLGLAIAKEIVTLHGGAISASSKNHVVTFTVSLPLLN